MSTGYALVLGLVEVSSHVGQTRGFTLIESMIAMIVFVAASLALVPLIMSGIVLQANSRNASRAHSVARAKTEELRGLPVTDAQLAVGGSLVSDVVDHFDQPAGTPFTRRWVVAAGPAGTLDVTVTVVSNNSTVTVAPFQFQVLLPP